MLYTPLRNWSYNRERSETFQCPVGTIELCQLNRLSRSEFVAWRFSVRNRQAIGVKAPFSGFVEPALATSIDKVPGGERWIHEIKFDGYRIQLHIRNDAVRIFTRRGNAFKMLLSSSLHAVGLVGPGTRTMSLEAAARPSSIGFEG